MVKKRSRRTSTCPTLEREREKKNTKTHTKRRMPDINSPHSSNTPRLLRRHPHRIPLIIPRHKTRIVDFDNRPVRRSIYIRQMLTRCICRRYKTGSQFSSKRQKKEEEERRRTRHLHSSYHHLQKQGQFSGQCFPPLNSRNHPTMIIKIPSLKKLSTRIILHKAILGTQSSSHYQTQNESQKSQHERRVKMRNEKNNAQTHACLIL